MTSKTTQDWHGCPLRFAAAILGDSWSLIVLRDRMFRGPLHFVELSGSAEGISTNTLTSRLNKLRKEGLIQRLEDENGSKHLKYALTHKGDALLPVFTEIIAWSGNWDKDSTVPAGFSNRIKTDKASIGLQDVREMHNSIEGN